MKTILQVEIISQRTVTPDSIHKIIRLSDVHGDNINGIVVTLKETVITLPPRKLTLSEVAALANKAGEEAVEEFFLKHGEPMYCGRAYLYTMKPKPRTRTGKMMIDQTFYPTGRAARTQSLDMQECWTAAATKVFEEHGISIGEKSWVD